MIKADAGLHKAKRRASSQYTESGEKLPNVCGYQERAKRQVSAVNDADCRMYHAAKEAPGHHFCGGLWTAARATLDTSRSPGLQKSQARSARRAKETSGGV